MQSTSRQWQLRTNASTLQDAKRHREIWTSKELDFVLQTLELPLEEVARALGRTYAATSAMRWQVRHGRAQASAMHREVGERTDREVDRLCGEHYIVKSVTGICSMCGG